MVSVYGAMTKERKARIWHLWQQGRPMSEIARDIVKPPATVYSFLYHGGLKPRERIRRANSLTLEERELISRGLAKGDSLRSIAIELGRAPSTASREVARNGGVDRYRACVAEKTFLKRSKRPKPLLLRENRQLRECVTQLLEADWSPEQIAGWLKSNPRMERACVYRTRRFTSRYLFRPVECFVKS